MSTAAAVGQSKHLVQRLLPFKTKASDVSPVTEEELVVPPPPHWGGGVGGQTGAVLVVS